MAQRRMFSPKVTSTDSFLDMPVSARELYFQLGMNADDDGFITPKRIMRMIGATEDDLKVLIAKHFVIPFDSGVIVISAWKINNLVRKDWYQETQYLEEKAKLSEDENGCYQLVNEMLPNSSTQDRIGKDRIGEDSIDNSEKQSNPVNDLLAIFYEFNPATNFGNKTQRSAIEWLIRSNGAEKAKQIIEFAIKIQGEQFAPTITTPVQLQNKFGDLMVFAKRAGNKKGGVIKI